MKKVILIALSLICLSVNAQNEQQKEQIRKLEKQMQRQVVARNTMFATLATGMFITGLAVVAEDAKTKNTLYGVAIASGTASLISAFVWQDAQMKINKLNIEYKLNSVTIKF